jgi:hypothetical protein
MASPHFSVTGSERARNGVEEVSTVDRFLSACETG